MVHNAEDKFKLSADILQFRVNSHEDHDDDRNKVSNIEPQTQSEEQSY